MPSDYSVRVFETSSAAQTEALGEELADSFLDRKIFLFGDLGMGKTTFLRGLAKGLKIKSKIKSPTFVGEHVHKIPNNGELVHLDLYRYENLEPEKEQKLRELFSSDETVVVEWSEKIPKRLFPKKRVELRFKELKSGTRKISLRLS